MNQQNPEAKNQANVFNSSFLIRQRNIHHLSQQFIADSLEVHQTKVGRWEASSAIPNANEVKALANIFGVDINDFYSLQ